MKLARFLLWTSCFQVTPDSNELWWSKSTVLLFSSVDSLEIDRTLISHRWTINQWTAAYIRPKPINVCYSVNKAFKNRRVSTGKSTTCQSTDRNASFNDKFFSDNLFLFLQVLLIFTRYLMEFSNCLQGPLSQTKASASCFIFSLPLLSPACYSE